MNASATLWSNAPLGHLPGLVAAINWEVLGGVLVMTAVGLPVLLGLFYAGYYVFSLPLRRQERARLLLDLIETGLETGGGLETAVIGAVRRGGQRLGKPILELAERLAGGLPLAQALEATPGALPPPVTALLRAGAEMGELPRAITGARRLLREGTSPLLKAQHYLMLLAFVTSPAWMAVFGMLTVFVLPKLTQIHYDMSESAPTGLMQWLAEWRLELLAVQAAVFLGLWFATLLYWGGPRLKAWLRRCLPLPWSGFALRIPWQRQRLLRDFATLLGLALDAGLPEPRAVMLAAEGSANEVLRRRAVAVLKDLQDGRQLPHALRHIDDGGELEWRVETAARGGGEFVAALAGWEEALDARAFQLEQTAAQIATTSLVLLNGAFVAVLTIAVFQMLTQLITGATLW
jgi:type II secretory pathway component PulF